MWDLELVCGLASAGLERRARELDEEEALRGIDALGEVELHALLREGLAAELACGGRLGVLAEERYPGDRARSRRSEGERCDIVLLPAASGKGDDARHLIDPLQAGTLFEGRGIRPEQALWIEVKVAGQFAMIDGVGRANPGYSGVLLREVPRDARKLAADPVIRAAGEGGTDGGAVMVVMFNADDATAVHDLDAWRARCVEKRVPLDPAPPTRRRLTITDRIGNGVCTTVMAPTGER